MDKCDIIGNIDSKYSGMSKGHKAIADYIRNSSDTAVFMTASRIGQELGISESTVVRFASSLGYDGFPEFQKYLVAWVKIRMEEAQKKSIKYGNRSDNNIINSVLKGDISRINDTITNLDPVAFDTAIDILKNAKRVFICGIRNSAPLAEFLAFYLNILRDNVVCITTTSVSETFEQMIRINSEDAFIGISFPRYSMRTLKAFEFAADRNAQIIALTDDSHSPMCMYSNINLFAKSDMVSVVDSLVAPLSVINAIVVAFCLKSPEEVNESLKNLEDVYGNYQVYMNDEMNVYDDEDNIEQNIDDMN